MRKSGWIGSRAIRLFVLFCLPLFTVAQTWGPKTVSMTYGSGGYYEYLPVGYDDPANATKRYPVILFIHGIGEMGNGTSDLWKVRTVGFPTVINSGNFPPVFNVGGQDFSFIAIVPQFSGWPGNDQVQNILNYIEANYRADASRLYLTGLSMGGGVTWEYAAGSPSFANRLAAILPVCGASNPSSSKTQVIASSNLPVLATHNQNDPTVTVWNTIGYVDGINTYNPNPSAIKVIWPDAIHNAWSRTYDPYEKITGNLNVYQWFLQHSRGSATPPPPAALSVNISSTTQISCFGANNGSATASASGGTGPYTYSWNTSPVQTTATATNLAPGNYTVTARDAVGATATRTVTISQPSQLVLTATAGTIATYGGSTSVSLSASGGTAPYTYSGQTTNVVAGTYSYTVTDAKGCTDTKSVTIINPPPTPVVATLSTWKDATCFGGSNGSATMELRGGVPPFTYSWNTNPVQTTLTASNLPAGIYTMTVRDANNTTSSATVNIGQPGKLNLNVTPGTITVPGGSTTVTLSASGGTAPYTYTGQTASVTAGTYTYTVTDANGCTESKTITISDPVASPALTASISSSVSLSCYDGSNGSATVSVSGGTAPYTYSWNTSPAQTGSTATNLVAGNYTVTVRDAANNTATASVTISQPSQLVLNLSAGAITTYGGTTTVSLSATGGTPGYTFNGPTANVSAGTYTYSVLDSKGCSVSRTVTITQPAAPPASFAAALETWKDVSCNGGADGSATLTTFGGTAPYTYSWNTNPVQTTQTANNLRAGTYTATVKDANNNTSTVTVTIVDPAAINLVVTPGAIPFNGGSTSVSLSASGGTAPYTYSGPTSNVTAGTYTYTVTDAKGCSATKTVTITEPSPAGPLAISFAQTNNSCFGSSTGTATAVVSGGTAPFTYSWSSGQTSANISGLRAGNYTVTVRDAANVSVTGSVTITEPAALALSVVPGSITTNGGTTTVTLSASGGNAPYTFSGPTTNVKAGTYTYSVTDANGCADSKTVTITEPVSISPVKAALNTWKDVSCAGGSDGSATVVVSAGTAPYTYSWNTVPAQTTATAVNLKAGSYIVTVRDANNTSAEVTVNIVEPTPLKLTATPGTIANYGDATDVSLLASGGTAPYTFSGSTTGLKAGTYTFTVTDAKGCTDTKTVTITQPDPVPPSIYVFTWSDVRCAGGNDGSATVTVTGGKPPYTYSWTTIPEQTGPVANGLKAGNYDVTVKDANGLTATARVSIAEPQPLVLTVNANAITTFNGTTTVNLNATGGTAPYSYSGGQVINVSAGTYTYVVTDAKGCTDSKTVTITQPAPPPSAAVLVLTANSTAVSCFGESNGSASVSVESGTAPYKYSWNTVPVQTTQTATGLKAGTYVVTVTDANNISSSVSVTVIEPNKLSLNAQASTITINGGTSTVNLTATGGTQPYVYSGETTNLRAGTYSYKVTDAKGCTDAATLTITEPAPPAAALQVSVSSVDVSCFGAANGSATANVSGGTAPYTYRWSTGATTESLTGLNPGSYSVTVADANGRSANGTVVVSEPSKLVLTVSAGEISQRGGSTNATLNASGGRAPYNFSGPTTNLTAGTYEFTVTDAKGCTDRATVTITEPAQSAPAPEPLKPLILTAEASPIKCFGGVTSVRLRVSGGLEPYKIAGDTVNVKAGNHQFSVTDATGNTVVQSLNITEPEMLQLTATSGLIRKIGGSTNVELNAKGGVAPYNYIGAVTDVKAGVYQYSVVDANSCKSNAEVEVREPAVKLSSFELEKGDTSIDLKWATSYEYAIDHFEIERSFDNSNFTLVAKVSSLWSSMRVAKYLAKDGRPAPKRNYYRIMAVTSYGEKVLLDQKDLFYDNRGKVAVRNMTNTLDITIENSFMEDLQVVLYDMNGRPLKTKTFSKQTFVWNTKFDMQGLPSGTYVISINSAHVKHAKQVVKL